MTLEDLKKIHKIDTEILLNVINICKKHNIQYFLMYGSLIGAVRHNGPIPWDDDVDIGMTRENYMRFLEVAEKELDPHNQLTIMGSGDPQYLSELKIGRKGSRYYLDGTQDLNVMHQIQLDIFLLDYIKKLSPIQTRLFEMVRNILIMAKLNWDEKKLIIRCGNDTDRKGKYILLTGLVCVHLLRVLFGEKQIEKWIYQMFVDETKTSGQMGVAMLTGALITVPDTVFSSTLMHSYDGHNVHIPQGYHELLLACYGDYMQCPPHDQRYNKRFNQYILEFDE